MTDTPVTTEARERRGRWPGLVWLVPLAALLLVGFLAVRAIAHRGVDVVVTFPNSAGAQVGDTKVIYQGVVVGRVTKITINKDHKRIDMTLRLDDGAKPYLRTGTEFWLVGAKPSLTDVSSLKAALAGVTIGVAPGPGQLTRHFIGLERPPAVPPGTPGRLFLLTADKLESVRQNSGVFYRGAAAGKVTAIHLNGLEGFTISVFLDAPYDRLVRPDTLFWIASPLQLSISNAGVRAALAPGDAALTGGIEFNTPPTGRAQPESPPGTRYELYDGHGEAIAGGRGPQVAYGLTFKGPVGDLEEGAPVKLAGRQIGAVRDVGFSLSADGRKLRQPVTVTIRPERLNLPKEAVRSGDWRGATDAALAGLIARGYRARLVQNPPLLGPRSVSLDYVKGAAPAVLARGPETSVLPTVASSDASGLADKASDILDKIDAVPLQQIGENVRELTANLSSLTGSPKVKDSLDHLDSTLNQVDQVVKKVNPQVGPLITKLNTAADQLSQTAAAANGVLSGQGATQDSSLPAAIRELTDAARSIRALTDYLGRHPEAVLRGKVKDRQ